MQLQLDAPDVLRYHDPRRDQRRVVRLARKVDEARLQAFLLAGDTSAQSWMKTLLEDGVQKALRGITTLEEVLSTCHHDLDQD